MAENLVVAVKGDTSHFKRAMDGVQGELKQTFSGLEAGVRGPLGNIQSSLGDIVGAAGKATMALGAIGLTGVVAGFGASIAAATGFEKSLSAIKAVSGATGDEMKDISALALQLGKDTSFSASEAAAGIEELIKGGVDIADVVGGGAAAALNLAAAGSVSLADASEIASNAMSMFGLKGKDMAMVSDQIAGAANASSLSVTDFKFSLSAVGAVANLAGQSFQDTATGIALMGASGIKGSDAGTSLKTMLMNLVPTTKTQSAAMRELGLITADGANKFLDAEGNFQSLGVIAGELNKALAGTSEAYQTMKLEAIFGSDAIRAGAILTKAGAAGFNEMAASMSKVTAAAVAKERLDNFAGSLEQLKGSLETAAITFGMAFLPALKNATDGLTGLLNAAMPFIELAGTRLAGAMTTATAAFQTFSTDGPAAVETGMASLVDWVQAHVGDWIGSLQTWAVELVAWIGPMIVPMLNKLQDLREAALAWVVEQIPGWIETLGQWGLTLVKWVAPMINPALQELAKFLGRTLDWIIAQAPGILQTFLSEWLPAMIGWVGAAALALAKELPSILVTVGSFILESVPKIFDLAAKLGKAIIDGLISGVGSLGSKLISTLLGEVNAALDAVRGPLGLDADSPSKVYMKVGEDITAGLVAGIVKDGDAVHQALDRVTAPTSRTGGRAIAGRQFANQQSAWQRTTMQARLFGRPIGNITGDAAMSAVQEGIDRERLRMERGTAWEQQLLAMLDKIAAAFDGGLTVEMDGRKVGGIVSANINSRGALLGQTGGGF